MPPSSNPSSSTNTARTQTQKNSGVPELYIVAPHTHNGIDSPEIAIGAAQNTYAGIVNSDGTAFKLPTAWTSTRISTGLYTITHNLGVQTSVVTSVNTASNPPAYASPGMGLNSFTISVTQAGTYTDMQFNFVLVTI